MRDKPTAIGYLRQDVSGASQQWDETQMRALAKKLGYDYAKTIVFTRCTENRLLRLIQVVERVDAEAVFVPTATHFSDHVPPELIQFCDVITVSPLETYARRIAPPIFADGA
ncbi:hypothetical protein ACWDYH_13985 [Nocardia goodfellowii]